MDNTKSKTSQAMKIQWGKLIPGILIVVFLIILVMQLIPRAQEMLKKEEIIHLYFDYDSSSLPQQHKCMHMTLVTKHMDKINLTQFDTLNITYSSNKNFSLLPSCVVNNATYFYFKSGPLSYNNITIGVMCMEYYVDYVGNDSLWVEYDQLTNDYKVAESEEVLNKLYSQCEVE